MSKLKRILFNIGLAKYPTTNKERRIEANRIATAIVELEQLKLEEEAASVTEPIVKKSSRRRRKPAKKA